MADEAAEDIVVAELANGKLCEAIDVQSPKSLSKQAPAPDPERAASLSRVWLGRA